MKYIIAIMLALASASAIAQHRELVSVEPQYERVYVQDNRRYCDNVPTGRQYNPTGAIVGGLVGYAIGREANHSRGYSSHDNYRGYSGHGGWQRDSHYNRRDHSNVGAYGGAVAGAIVGGSYGNRVVYEQRCYYRDEGRFQDVQRGYKVTYRERGRFITVYQNHHPGY